MDYNNLGMGAEFSDLMNSTSTTTPSYDGLSAPAWEDKNQYFTSAGQESGLLATDMTMQDLDMNDIQFGNMDFSMGFQ